MTAEMTEKYLAHLRALVAAGERLTPAQVDDLFVALDAATKDTARIDWLETAAKEPGGILLHDGSECGRCGLGLRPGLMVRTLREAIDSASARRDYLSAFIASRTASPSSSTP